MADTDTDTDNWFDASVENFTIEFPFLNFLTLIFM